MTLALRVLIGLVAGFLLGLALAGSSSPAAAAIIGVLTPVGVIFVNLIRMTVVPLVVSMLIASVGAMTMSELASIVLAVVFTSFTVPSIPGGSIVAVVPVLVAAHLPIEAVGILLAVDTIPDMFRTTANVTGALTLAAVVGGSRQVWSV